MHPSDTNQLLPIISKQSTQKFINHKKQIDITNNNQTEELDQFQSTIQKPNPVKKTSLYLNGMSQHSQEPQRIQDEIQIQYHKYKEELSKKLQSKEQEGDKSNPVTVKSQIYHNKALETLLHTKQMNDSEGKLKGSQKKIISNRDNVFVARVQSLHKKYNDNQAIKNNKNSCNKKIEKQFNVMWMDALKNMGIYRKDDHVNKVQSQQRISKNYALLKIHNLGQNHRYVRKLKPLPNVELKKQRRDFDKWKMKIRGKGQNNQPITKQKYVISDKEQSNDISDANINGQSMKKLVYTQENEERLSVRLDQKEIRKNERQQEQWQTLSNSNSYMNDPHIHLIQKKSHNWHIGIGFERNSWIMDSANPQQPLILIPQSSTFHQKKSKNKSHRHSEGANKNRSDNEKSKTEQQAKKGKIISQNPNKYKKQFRVPFDTYYYRDFIWKVNYTNQLIVHTPLEYEHRLRIFIGRGNNSGLIRGLMKRRIWFAVTDRIEDANVVWTQLKYLPYFNLQLQTPKNLQNLMDKRLDTFNISGKGIMSQEQRQIFMKYYDNNHNIESRQDERILNRCHFFTKHYKPKKNDELQQNDTIVLKQQTLLIRNIISKVGQIRSQKMHNHLINNYMIGNKKTLFKTLTAYYKKKDDYVFNYLPYTFHVEFQDRQQDVAYDKFVRFYEQRQKQIDRHGKDGQYNEKNYWIVKPGQNSNRGYGIKFCKSFEEIQAVLSKKQQVYQDGTHRTYILQTYIDRPLLYQKRKFDLRHYMMVTCINGILKGYWYREGYARTTSTQYSLKSNENKIHLTNDAIQKNMADYGKYEKGNKISYDDLDLYLNKYYGYKNYQFKEIILPKMKKIGTDIMMACSGSIDPEFRNNNFEIFGLDFMIDAEFNLWLIEVNTNPCLEISCPLLGNLIPKMIQNALELTVDAIFPPPQRYTPKGVHYFKKIEEENRFDLIYDSRMQGIQRQSNNVLDENLLEEEDETFEDDGSEWSGDD